MVKIKHQDERIFALILDLINEYEELPKRNNISEFSLAELRKLAFWIDKKINGLELIVKGRYINERSIESLICNGIRGKTKVHDKLAGAWLGIKKNDLWGPEKIIERFNLENLDTPNYFWDAYVGFYNQEKLTTAVSKTSNPTNIIIEIEQLFPITRYQDKINNILGKQFLMILEGVTGSGKTYLLNSINKFYTEKKEYTKILTPTVSKAYTLNMLLHEEDFFQGEDISGYSAGRIADKVIDYLQTNNILLILDNFENADEESFMSLIEQTAKINGKTRLAIGQNQKFEIIYNRAKNIIHVGGYTFNELDKLFKQLSIEIDEDDINLLLEKTDGIPICVEIFIESLHENYTNINIKIKQLIFVSSYRSWIESFLDSLAPSLSKFLDTISLTNGTFTPEDIYSIANFIAVADPEKILASLIDRFLIEKINDHEIIRYKVLQPISEYAATLPISPQKRKMNEVFANYFWPQINFKGKREFSIEELQLVIKAIKHLQKAGDFYRAGQFLHKCLPYLKRYGLYRTIIEITDYEIKYHSRKNRNNWIDWENAHASFILGDIYSSHTVIVPLIIYHFSNSGTSHELFSETIAKTIKYIQLYSEILEQLDKAELGLNLLLDSLSMFDIEDYEWRLRSHAASIIAYLYDRIGNSEKAIEITQDLLKDIDTTARGIAIAYTRLGIFFHNASKWELARFNLEKALEYYNREPHKDLRAISWCSLYLSSCLYKLGITDSGEEHLKKSLEISRNLKLFDKNSWQILQTFTNYSLSNELKILLDSEISRCTICYVKLIKPINNSEVLKGFNSIRAIVIGRIDENFDYKILLKPIDHTSKRINSRAVRSVLRRAKKSPDFVIENIFDRKQDIKEIFGFHFYNKLITESLKKLDDKQRIINKYIIPNLRYILESKDNKDRLKFHYARALEYANDIDTALTILDSIQEHNWNCEYYIIKGNCFKNKNFQTSYDLYKTAELLAKTYREKGRVCNNIAQLIFYKKRSELYKEAKEMCEHAREYWKNDWVKSLFAITLRILIEIEESGLEHVLINAGKLADLYGLHKDQANQIYSKVGDVIKRNKLLDSNK